MDDRAVGGRRGRVVALVVAAGEGRRMGAGVPKQLLPLAGKPVLLHSLAAFDRHPQVDALCVAARPAYHSMLRLEKPWTDLHKELLVVSGGNERSDSVWNALEALEGRAGVVIIHDGVRPLVTEQMISATLAHALEGRGAIIALPVSDTVKVVGEDGFIDRTLDRSRLWLAQTPQAFPYEMIHDAHRRAREQGLALTDDAQAAENAGYDVAVVRAMSLNLKITRPEDLAIAEAFIRAQETARSKT